MNRSEGIYKIVLADDDIEDCFLFKESLDELQIPVELTIVHDGEKLMELLCKKRDLPDIIFLDLNMPRKNGFQCLKEIKKDETLKILPVIIISTTIDTTTINTVFEGGAAHFIQKPPDFSQQNYLISQALNTISVPVYHEHSKEKFVILPQARKHESK